jgi:hypothetical protein
MRPSSYTAWGFYTRSSIAHGCAFHPCAIDDPRGRAAVRARSDAAVRAAAMRPSVLDQQALRALRANRVFRADEKRIRTENTVMDKSKGGLVWFRFHKDRRLRADVFFIRAQSTIRADGPPSAQDRAPLFELPGCIQAFPASKHCALCAPTVFLLRMKSTSVAETWLWIKPKAVWIGFYARSNLCNNGRRDVRRHA